MAWFRKLWEGRRSGSSHRREIVGANSLLRGDLEHRSAASLTGLPGASDLSRAEDAARAENNVPSGESSVAVIHALETV